MRLLNFIHLVKQSKPKIWLKQPSLTGAITRTIFIFFPSASPAPKQNNNRDTEVRYFVQYF